jgi:predicted RNase H-like HicB family nuclease
VRLGYNKQMTVRYPVATMRYPVAIEPGTDTAAFGVVIPDLPGAFSAGDTSDEAMAGAEEAAAAWIEWVGDTGQSGEQ